MRYEVRTILTGHFGPVIVATDNAAEAKTAAEQHSGDTLYGSAILDTLTHTADLGCCTVAIDDAFRTHAAGCVNA